MAISGYPKQAQAAGWPEHRLQAFRDPDAEKYAWAKALHPRFERRVLCDEALSERLIVTVADVNRSLVREGEHRSGGNRLCIAGSRVLQRIIGTRYLGTGGPPDRVLYPVTDIDVWAQDSETLNHLAQVLEMMYRTRFYALCKLSLGADFSREPVPLESQRYALLGSPFSRQDIGLYYNPLFFHGPEDNPRLSPFLAKVDASCPLPRGNYNERDPTRSGPVRLTAAGRSRARLLEALYHSKDLPMAVVEERTIMAPSLSDMQYLASLQDVAASRHCAQNTKEKLTGSVLPLMLYLEATRRMGAFDWKPDDFSRHLLRLCAGQIPERLIQLESLLRKISMRAAELVYQVSGLGALPLEPPRHWHGRKKVASSCSRKTQSLPDKPQEEMTRGETSSAAQRQELKEAVAPPVHISKRQPRKKNARKRTSASAGEMQPPEAQPVQLTWACVVKGKRLPDGEESNEPGRRSPSAAVPGLGDSPAAAVPAGMHRHGEQSTEAKVSASHAGSPTALQAVDKSGIVESETGTQETETGLPEKAVSSTRRAAAPQDADRPAADEPSVEVSTEAQARETGTAGPHAGRTSPATVLGAGSPAPAASRRPAEEAEEKDTARPEVSAGLSRSSPVPRQSTSPVGDKPCQAAEPESESLAEVGHPVPAATRSTKGKNGSRSRKGSQKGKSQQAQAASSITTPKKKSGKSFLAQYLAEQKKREACPRVEPHRHTSMLFQDRCPEGATDGEKRIFDVSAEIRVEIIEGTLGCYGRPYLLWSDEDLANKRIADRLYNKLSPVDGDRYPYANYFRGIIQCSRDSSRFLACQQLFRAALAGVTGAAFELLLLCLRDRTRPLPLCVPLQLMRHCFSHAEGGVYLAHVHYRSQSLPADWQDAVVSTLACCLATHPTPAHWKAAGQALSKLSATMDPCEREARLVLAAFAWHIGQEPALAHNCRISHKRIKQMPPHQALDWLIINSMAQEPDVKLSSVPETIRAWLPCQVFMSLLARNEGALRALLDGLTEEEDSFFLEWIPLCLIDPSAIAGFESLPELKKFWQARQVASPCSSHGSGTGSQEASFPEILHDPLPPVGDWRLAQMLEESSREEAKKTADQWRTMDIRLLRELVGVPCEHLVSPSCEHHDLAPTTDVGIKLTAAVMLYLGASAMTPTPEGRPLIHFGRFDPAACKVALQMLRPAVAEFANPYACWFYARLRRAELLAARPCPGGEQAWKDHYIGLLLYAAVTGVKQAFEDLLLEFRRGRADACLPVIIHLIQMWPRLRLRLELKLGLSGPSAWQSVAELFRSAGAVEAASWISSVDTCGVQLLCLAEQSSSRQGGLRLTLLGTAMTSFRRGEACWQKMLEVEKKSAIQVSLDLQLSMLHFIMLSPWYSDKLSTLVSLYLSPPLRHVRASWPILRVEDVQLAPLEAVPEEFWMQILASLQWHGSQPSINCLREIARQRVSKKNLALCEDPARKTRVALVHALLFMDSAYGLRDTLRNSGQQEGGEAEGRGVLRIYKEVGSLTPPLCVSPLLLPEAWHFTLFPVDALFSRCLAEGRPGSEFMGVLVRAVASLQDGPLQGGLVRLRRIENAEVTQLRTLLHGEYSRQQELTRTNASMSSPINPYIALMVGLVDERDAITCFAKNPKTTRAVVQAAASYLDAAMLGCDDGVRHLARVALAYPNSPVAVERVLDLFLAQRRRPMRHRLRFELPGLPVCGEEQSVIMARLEEHCFSDTVEREYSGSVSKELQNFLEKQLIPALKALKGQLTQPNNQAWVQLMLSCCFIRVTRCLRLEQAEEATSEVSQRIQQECVDICFKMLPFMPSNNQVSHMCHSLLDQWMSHLSMVWWPSEVARLVELRIAFMREKSGKQMPSARSIPLLLKDPATLSGPVTDDGEKKKLHWLMDWQSYEGGWSELMLFMGHDEMLQWQECYADAVLHRTIKGDAGVDQHLIRFFPGIHKYHRFQNALLNHVIMFRCLGRGAPLPIPTDFTEVRFLQYWFTLLAVEYPAERVEGGVDSSQDL